MPVIHKLQTFASRNAAAVGPALVLCLVLLALLPSAAQAAAIEVPFVTDFGCSVVQWLKGPLAILIFVTVVVGTLVLGMITRMQWDRVISICVIFGIIIGLGAILSGSNYIQNVAGMSACLQ